MLPVSARERIARSLSAWLFALCGTWLVALGSYFIWLRPPLLREDARFIGASVEAERSFPHMLDWLQRVFTVLGGFMIATGAVTVAAVRNAPANGWQVAALTVAGVSGVWIMSVVNFAIDSDFKWLLTVPPAMWLLATVARAMGK